MASRGQSDGNRKSRGRRVVFWIATIIAILAIAGVAVIVWSYWDSANSYQVLAQRAFHNGNGSADSGLSPDQSDVAGVADEIGDAGGMNAASRTDAAGRTGATGAAGGAGVTGGAGATGGTNATGGAGATGGTSATGGTGAAGSAGVAGDKDSSQNAKSSEGAGILDQMTSPTGTAASDSSASSAGSTSSHGSTSSAGSGQTTGAGSSGPSASSILKGLDGLYTGKHILYLPVKVDPDTEALRNMTVDWDYLRSVNPEVVAWVYMPGTPINYPVVHTGDNTTYLHKDFEGNVNYTFSLGTIYLDAADSGDFSDKNNVLYGHHMDDGSMFACLSLQLTDEAQFNANRIFYVLTPTMNYECRSFALVITTGTDPIVMTSFPSSDDFAGYILDKEQRSVVQPSEGMPDPTAVSKLFTLSTCDYSRRNGRAALFGQLVRCIPPRS